MDAQRPSLSEQIRRAAAECGLGRNALARLAGVDKAALSRFMTGRRSLTLPTADKLAAALGLAIKVTAHPSATGGVAPPRRRHAAGRPRAAGRGPPGAAHEHRNPPAGPPGPPAGLSEPPADLPGPPRGRPGAAGPADLAFLRQFIAARRWQFAETYAKTAPHEYNVRGWLPGPQDQADFERFVTLVRACGYDRTFRRRTYRSLDVDGFTYWSMGAPVPATTVINRAALGKGAKRG
ncbi:MAG: helix-turn-helix transcriptional regulator [Planctomycetota bacterium]|nr:helix-turn-helix transcriptional regulator [Planctomycetota bacterium]